VIKRYVFYYDPCDTNGEWVKTEEASDGDWIKYEDCLQLIRDHESLLESLKALGSIGRFW